MLNRCQKAEPRRLKFTDLAVGRLKPGIYWDALLPTFGIRVGATSRTWIVAVKGSKRKLGRYPAMSLAEARDQAREMMEEPKGVSYTPFQDLAEQFLAHGRTRKGRPLTANTLAQYRRNLRRYAAPLHQRPFAEITRRDIASLLRDVAATSGAPTASLTRSMLHRLFEFSIEVGEREDNPVAHTPSYEVAKRSRTLTDGELAALWAATHQLHQNGVGGDYALIVRCCLWLGVRRSEAGGMRWSELHVDNINLIWHIPGSRTKNGRPLVLPLPRQLRDIVTKWPRVVGKDTLFGVHSSRGFTSWSESKAALDAQLKFSRPWILHDLRRTCETRLAGLGVSREVRSRILNHDIGPIAEAYDHHSYQPEMKSALQRWADKLAEIVTSAQPGIIKLPRRKRS